jgi:HlyD family secretion protein
MTRRWSWVLLLLVALGSLLYWRERKAAPNRYVTAQVKRGSIIQAVTTTGTVNPVTVVQVGTYVSGPIVTVYCDFNTEVKKGQLCAKIDPRPYAIAVEQARANLANGRAQLEKDTASLGYDELEFERNFALLKQDAVSVDTVDSARSTRDQGAAQVQLDKANILQQQAALHAAEVNLGYTNIISPVDGTVVSRNVDVGQTVAASFQTPTLFLIARDLTKMQVDTNVSESDVGPVQIGQKATFTVDAFPGHPFRGSVSQVRQAPITVQNVVTYDVVLNVANPELLLKPGMTANARIITAERHGVLKVPLQALRFLPHGVHAKTNAEYAQSERDANVWVLDGQTLRKVSIVRGLDDGSSVEVLSDDLHRGDKVVIDENAASQEIRHSGSALSHVGGLHHF